MRKCFGMDIINGVAPVKTNILFGGNMELNLKNIHSPCMNCYIRGHSYSTNDATCQCCEYNIAIQLVKVLLKFNEGCALCKNRNRLGGGYWDCKISGDDDCVCNVTKDYSIDWQAAFKEYGYEFK